MVLVLVLRNAVLKTVIFLLFYTLDLRWWLHDKIEFKICCGVHIPTVESTSRRADSSFRRSSRSRDWWKTIGADNAPWTNQINTCRSARATASWGYLNLGQRGRGNRIWGSVRLIWFMWLSLSLGWRPNWGCVNEGSFFRRDGSLGPAIDLSRCENH